MFEREKFRVVGPMGPHHLLMKRTIRRATGKFFSHGPGKSEAGPIETSNQPVLMGTATTLAGAPSPF